MKDASYDIDTDCSPHSTRIRVNYRDVEVDELMEKKMGVVVVERKDEVRRDGCDKKEELEVIALFQWHFTRQASLNCTCHFSFSCPCHCHSAFVRSLVVTSGFTTNGRKNSLVSKNECTQLSDTHLQVAFVFQLTAWPLYPLVQCLSKHTEKLTSTDATQSLNRVGYR